MSGQPYSNEMRLAVFPARKEKPNQPDYRATFQINGVEYKASLWTKPMRSGGECWCGPVEIAPPKPPPNVPPQSAYEQPAPKPAERVPGIAYRASAEQGMRTEGNADEDVPF